MSKAKRTLCLFLDFLQIGCFTFGGGWSIIAQMREKYVEKEKCLTAQELLDLTSVSRSTPGIMIANLSMQFGYREAGIPGGLACLLGLSLSPIIILMVVTHFYTLFEDNRWVEAAMAGVRSAVVPIIIGAVLGLLKGAFSLPPCILVGVLTLVLYLFLHVSCVCLVVLGIVCGLLINEYYERKKA